MENNQVRGMEEVTENKTGYELRTADIEWWLHTGTLQEPFTFVFEHFSIIKSKKSTRIPWVQVPHQLLGSCPGAMSLNTSNWARRKLCRALEVGAMPPLVGSCPGGQKTNQPIPRDRTEKGQEGEGGIPKIVFVLATEMPSWCQCLSSTWLQSQTSWVQGLTPLPTSCVTVGKLLSFSVSSPTKWGQ